LPLFGAPDSLLTLDHLIRETVTTILSILRTADVNGWCLHDPLIPEAVTPWLHREQKHCGSDRHSGAGRSVEMHAVGRQGVRRFCNLHRSALPPPDCRDQGHPRRQAATHGGCRSQAQLRKFFEVRDTRLVRSRHIGRSTDRFARPACWPLASGCDPAGRRLHRRSTKGRCRRSVRSGSPWLTGAWRCCRHDPCG
jgi:hypothetical protein